MIRYYVLSLKLVMVLVVSACSSLPIDSVPINSIATSGSHLGLLNKISIDRQRHFTLSSRSHLGLAIIPSLQASAVKTNSAAATIDMAVIRESHRVLAQSFKQVSLVTKEQPATNSLDFLVEMHVLHAEDQTKTNNEVSYTTKARKFKSKESTTKTRKRMIPKPHTAIIKLNLFDARTRKVLDVAIIKSRSGAFTHSDFDQFLKESLMVYAHSMVPTAQTLTY
ncbi:MAG: hypothetical protein ACRBCI_10815 [Cellvibrionaceae bacterium]